TRPPLPKFGSCSRRSARCCRADNPARRHFRQPDRRGKTAGQSRRSSDRGEQDRKFAWHILLWLSDMRKVRPKGRTSHYLRNHNGPAHLVYGRQFDPRKGHTCLILSRKILRRRDPWEPRPIVFGGGYVPTA